ncbi:16S rRNA (uracil(1498)-N(3))-methyltransferase [Angustibacter sp. McL0619]|uniref:16S rRNA (uracil(1498)-N(3))-methyltransferase n=1 Tax=Angustibacter sp. McL0619 TaxID=3415676 RepID=UPI003CF9929D
MSAPLFLLEPDALQGVRLGASVLLGGPEGRHAATVRRIVVGERVDVADGSGALARCTVTAVGRDELTLRVDEREDVPEPAPRFVLVQALAKGERDDLAIEAATELGVDEVVPWQAERSVVVWRGERGVRSHRKWEQTVRAAAKQSRRARVPKVGDLVDREGLVARVGAATLAVVLHEEATLPLAALDVPSIGEVLLVVGPEGGITPDEVDAMALVGATTCRIGREVLRSSTAGPAALSVLSAAMRWR